MTDFEKIMMVTKRAKATADRTKTMDFSQPDLTNLFLEGAANTLCVWLDLEYVKSLFRTPEDKIVVLKWYNTVYQMRLQYDGSK